MKRYLLDTNSVSYLIKGHENIAQRIQAVPMTSLCISVITEAELLFGLAKRPKARQLHHLVHAFLQRVDVLPWTREVAGRYGSVRAGLEAQGRVLAPLDMLIAAHALTIGAVLISSDRAFGQVSGLKVEDWR